jgi:FkbM family methyltransferase
MKIYESVASHLIGSPLQGAAEGVRWLLQTPRRLRHPELGDLFLEGERIRRLFKFSISDGMNCIDVGCHLGSVLQEFVRLSPSGRHIAVEPLPYKADWLKRKFPKVQVHQVAVGEREGRVEFFYSRRRSGYSGLRIHAQVGNIEKLEVQCKKLDDIVPPDAPIGFMKIDVEGGEYAVLRGAAQLIARERPLILFECTRTGLSAFGYEPSQIYALLVAEYGYKVYLIKDWLSRAASLSLGELESAMKYPFKAFNFVAAPM